MTVKALVPEKYRSAAARTLRTLRHLGMGVMCPCCRWHFRRFLPYGVVERTNALCPRCGSLERHRLLWLFLKNRTDLFDSSHRVLHFAPESIFIKLFAKMSLRSYVTADVASSLANIRMDITNIPYKDHSFDVVLCNHVLEHVVDDQKAMRKSVQSTNSRRLGNSKFSNRPAARQNLRRSQYHFAPRPRARVWTMRSRKNLRKRL